MLPYILDKIFSIYRSLLYNNVYLVCKRISNGVNPADLEIGSV